MSPLHVVVVALAGWINREQQKVIDYLKDESRVLREQLGNKRPRFTDDQRRRLAAKGKILGWIGILCIRAAAGSSCGRGA